ncbi:MAG: Rieske 2Fe-2S domain-containing protein [Gammaproteobacteria bacterium]|nr:Rieske 2Fe-2S domain-containing protein [Gammaproteobacteria bacterium]
MNAPQTGPANAITARYPELGTGPVSTEAVISPEYFEKEREKIFKKSWLNVGRIDQIPSPGDYMVRDLDILNTSLIIVQGQDSQVRAFHNACPHRGNKVAQGKGNTKGFACGFHGWTFNTEGSLVFVPDEEQFFDFDKGDFCLKAVNCETWNGFVFINVEEQPSETLLEWVGELDRQLDGYPFDDMVCLGEYRAEVKANWKVVIDAFQEAYHVAFVHRRTATGAYTSPETPYCKLSAVELYGRNRRGSVYANPDFTPSPSAAVAFKHGPTFIQAAQADLDKLPVGVNPERTPNWGFDINVIFPNFRFDPGQGFYFADNFLPISVDQTLYEIRLYMPRPRNAGEMISQENTRVLLRDIVREDLNTLETTQEALNTGVMDTIRFSDQEILCRHQYKVVDDIVNS